MSHFLTKRTGREGDPLFLFLFHFLGSVWPHRVFVMCYFLLLAQSVLIRCNALLAGLANDLQADDVCAKVSLILMPVTIPGYHSMTVNQVCPLPPY